MNVAVKQTFDNFDEIMFEELSNRFEAIFKKIRGRGKLSEENIAEAVRQITRPGAA